MSINLMLLNNQFCLITINARIISFYLSSIAHKPILYRQYAIKVSLEMGSKLEQSLSDSVFVKQVAVKADAEFITLLILLKWLRQQQNIQDMRSNTALLLAVLLSIAIAGIVPGNSAASQLLEHTPNPNDILKQVRFGPLDYCDPEVEVDVSNLNLGIHGIAYRQFRTLYPIYAPNPINRCRYASLGIVRFYTFSVSIKGSIKQVKTAVQTNAVNAPVSTASSPDEKDGFIEVSVSWAQEDPTISLALKTVIEGHWDVIKGNPLNSCWQKAYSGVWGFRFYFKNIGQRFEYNQSQVEAAETHPADSYYADNEPAFAVGSQPLYDPTSIQQFSKHPAYHKIVDQLNSTLGHFDEKWILNVSISSGKSADILKVSINFQPFLLKQNYEAHYYGNVAKAALLKIDERTFNGDGKSFQNWQQVKNFNSYFAFHEANEYVITQFNWLRFYKVSSAYTALHKTGRYVRLVYTGLGQFVDPKNQINIVVYIDECGRYYIDRNDFLATNLDSYGRNNWVSLFVQTPDVTKAAYYQSIVKFFKSIYPKFWNANQLVDIKFKDNLHVIEFKNPTNLNSDCVLDVSDDHVTILNKFTWTKVNDNSPLLGRLENYCRGKYSVGKIMFVQSLESDNGTHFEVSFLDNNNKYSAAYIRYIGATDVFTDDDNFNLEKKYYGNETYVDPLPKDIQTSIIDFLKSSDQELTAVVSFVSLAPRSFAVVLISGKNRWQVTLSWVDSKWVVSSKQPFNDGYFATEGYPSAISASCTGFLSKIYPQNFLSNYVYVLIETKNIGVSIYNRIVYDLGDKSVEAIVQVTFGVESSHILNSWKPLVFLRKDRDYGYGVDHSFDYGLDKSYFYEQEPTTSNLSVEPVANAATTEPIEPASPVTQEPCPAGTKPDLFSGQCVVVFF